MASRKRIASCLVRQFPQYRSEAFIAGLRHHGYKVVESEWPNPEPGDVLVIWNRYRHLDAMAKRYESAGATVLVAENGWIGTDRAGVQLYAIARSQHNGAGEWHVGAADRWSKLGIELAPWRGRGKHILVLPQRGIGPPGVGMPMSWAANVLSRLKEVTDRPIKVRVHPGRHRPPLEPDLESCHAAVVWASGAGIKAIVAGIPVFYEMDRWIGAPAAVHGIGDLEHPFLGDRFPMLNRMAWAQYTVTEIQSGAPFEWLLK